MTRGVGANEKADMGASVADEASLSGESQIREEEVYHMAAFRIRETANRIVTLANSARDQELRRALLTTCERLLAEEAALVARARR